MIGQAPPELYVALEQLNCGRYFECHETLEPIWIAERGPVRELYQGVIQIAVGCYHLTTRHNWVGAVNKLEQGAARLEQTGVTDAYGIMWPELIQSANRLAAHLRMLGREQVDAFEPSLLPVARFHRNNR